MNTKTLRWFGLSAVLGLTTALSTSSCGPTPGQCDATTCANGCCANGQCVSGTATNACGARGMMCVACPAGFTCSSGACTPVNAAGGTAGGSTAGGTAGGSTAGGTAGGSTAGGSAAGGSAAGGAAGGSAAGGAAGGSTAGGSAAGGAAGGSTAGGAAGGSAGGTTTPANFMVIRVGDGSAALANVNTAVFLEERSIATGSLVRTIDVSGALSSPGFGMSGTATSEGMLTQSDNGAYVVLTGYQAALGTTGIVGSSVPRTIVRVDAAGTVSGATVVTDAFSTNNIRGATTIDGTGYWAVGAISGVRYAVHNGSGMTNNVFADVANHRSVLVKGGQLFASTAGSTGLPPDGGSRIFSLGPASPTSSTYATLVGVDVQNPNSFVLLDLNPAVPGLDALYTSDTVSGANGGIRKYVFNGTEWSLAWRANTAEDAGASTCSHVTATPVGNDVTVLCVRDTTVRNLIVKYVEPGGNATTPPPGFALTAAPANTVYRGIAISPQ